MCLSGLRGSLRGRTDASAHHNPKDRNNTEHDTDATLVPSDITKSDEQLISNVTCTVYCKDKTRNHDVVTSHPLNYETTDQI